MDYLMTGDGSTGAVPWALGKLQVTCLTCNLLRCVTPLSTQAGLTTEV